MNLSKVPLAWRQEAIRKHIEEYPVATAADIIERLTTEFLLSGGFPPAREARIRALHTHLSELLTLIDNQKEGL